MTDCIFCKISSGEIPTKPIYEDEYIFAFDDINPAADIHFLIIPKKHIASLDECEAEDKELLGHIITKVGELAEKKGMKNGYRLVANCGEDGGQTVKHLHFHVLGGRKLQWPPG